MKDCLSLTEIGDFVRDERNTQPWVSIVFANYSTDIIVVSILRNYLNLNYNSGDNINLFLAGYATLGKDPRFSECIKIEADLPNIGIEKYFYPKSFEDIVSDLADKITDWNYYSGIDILFLPVLNGEILFQSALRINFSPSLNHNVMIGQIRQILKEFKNYRGEVHESDLVQMIRSFRTKNFVRKLVHNFGAAVVGGAVPLLRGGT